jgi:type II secretory pathway pseudopilin PulG
MWRCRRSTRPSRAEGFSSIELLVGITLMGLAMAATSSFFLAGNSQMRQQSLRTETDQAARGAVDMIVRDLRLGGACLPVTGDFISLEGVNSGQRDELTTRTGLVRPDMSCVRTATSAATANGTAIVQVENAEGFEEGMRIYLRAPSGSGLYTTIASSDEAANQITLSSPVDDDYPSTTGVYAIDERRFYLHDFTSPRGVLPELMLKIGDAEPISFAVGIEKLDFQYVLRRHCPACDVVDFPADESEWAIVEEVVVRLTARSELKDVKNDYYRRQVEVAVKPRNLLPR